MNTKGGMAVLFFATIAALMTSCSHDNVYDSDYINEQYKASFATNVLGGGTIDPTQTWNASAQSKLTVKVDLDAGATYRVCAFTENPLYTSDATLLDQETATSGSTVTLNFAKPIALTKVYVAAINAKNRYDVYAVDMEGTEASATIGGTETTRATVNGVSTAASSYQHEYSYFKVPEFDASKYTDVTTIDASDYSKLDLKPSESEGFKHGDGLHYYIPQGKTVNGNLNFTRTNDGAGIIYVSGTWEIPDGYKLTNNRQIVVTSTGKIILEGTCEFNSGARFTNNGGNITTTNGYFILDNATGTSSDMYNSGVMDMGNGGIKVAGNSSPLYNVGTYNAKFIHVGGSFTFTNFGTFNVKSTSMSGNDLNSQENAVSNFTLINGCHSTIDALGVHVLIMCDNSRVDCPVGIYTGGGNSGGNVYMGKYAVINAKDWIDNGGHIYGSTDNNEYSVFKFTGDITEQSCSAFITKGYVYYDGTFKDEYNVNGIRTGDCDLWNTNKCTYHMKYFTTEATSTLCIPKSSECSGAGYNPNNESGKAVVLTPTTYYYAYEDLGSVGDFDFNDVVLGVDYPVMNGTDKTAVIKVYAAGGTLPVSVKYNGTEICADVHTALNVSTSTMVNTGSQMSMDPVTIYTKTGITGTFDASNMDLSIVVKGTNTSTEIVPNVQSGQVPQMIKVPSPWRWPREQVNISAAYVSFGAWGCNYTANKTWYQNGDSSKTTAPK